MPVTDGPWWSAWMLDLPSLAFAAGLTALYLRGARSPGAVRRSRRTQAFLVGVGVVVVAQSGPAAAWGEVLLWPHMVQHLLLTVIAAPLLAFGAPVTVVRRALGPGPRRALVGLARRSRRWRRAIGDPPAIVVATAVSIVVLWAWHVPWLYDLAVRSPAVHLLEHVTFLASSVWFWSEVWATARRHRRLQALATLCLAAQIVQGGLLGALLSFAGRSLYDVYDGLGTMTALQDQQFAGALMWVPPGFVYASIAIRRFAAWMQAAELEQRRREVRDRAHRS